MRAEAIGAGGFPGGILLFLRHFIVGEMSGNTDTYWSVYMYKHRANDTIYTGPVWDFDLAFDNDQRIYPVNNKSDYIYRSGGSSAGNMRSLVNRIVVNDETTKPKLVNIWDEMRHNGLTEEAMLAFIDSLAEAVDASQRLNFIRWPILKKKVHQNPKAWGSYQAEVDNVKRYMRERIAWMDNKLGYTYVPNTTSAENIEATQRINFAEPYTVYDIYGNTRRSEINTLPAGVYIVVQGDTALKVLVHAAQ